MPKKPQNHWEKFNQDYPDADWGKLSPHQAIALRGWLDGRSFVDIGTELNISRQRACTLKNLALENLGSKKGARSRLTLAQLEARIDDLQEQIETLKSMLSKS